MEKDAPEKADVSITGRLGRLERNQPNLRVAALRAAAQITAAAAENGVTTLGGTPIALPGATLHFAEQFARWLETGER